MPLQAKQTMRSRRNNKITTQLSDKEMDAIQKYCKRYKIKNRSKLIRDMVFSSIMDNYVRDYPTLWDKQVMADLVVEKR